MPYPTMGAEDFSYYGARPWGFYCSEEYKADDFYDGARRNPIP